MPAAVLTVSDVARPDPPTGPIVMRPTGRGELAAIGAWLASNPSLGRPGALVCEADGLGPADARTVDALARLALVARGRGWTLRVTAVPPDLVELIELMGLTAALLDAGP